VAVVLLVLLARLEVLAAAVQVVASYLERIE
jgi:hypothetical protein